MAAFHCWVSKTRIALNPYKTESIILQSTIERDKEFAALTNASAEGSPVKLVNQIKRFEVTIDVNPMLRDQIEMSAKHQVSTSGLCNTFVHHSPTTRQTPITS